LDYTHYSILLSVALSLGMMLCLEIGRRIGKRHLKRDPAGALVGIGPIENAVFALLGLMVAFTFFGAASRFDARRHLIVEETNAIGTAFLRVDLLPSAVQPPLRELFKRYLDTRLEFYRKLPDMDAAKLQLSAAQKIQGEIWRHSVSTSRQQEAHVDAAKLLLPALNEMIDITTTRTMAMEMHPPVIIFILLIGLALTSSLLAGYPMAESKTHNWLHLLGFSLVMAVSVYVILDLEFPRLGLIRVDSFDQALVQLRESMNETK